MYIQKSHHILVGLATTVLGLKLHLNQQQQGKRAHNTAQQSPPKIQNIPYKSSSYFSSSSLVFSYQCISQHLTLTTSFCCAPITSYALQQHSHANQTNFPIFLRRHILCVTDKSVIVPIDSVPLSI
jgi:hypothetical protein